MGLGVRKLASVVFGAVMLAAGGCGGRAPDTGRTEPDRTAAPRASAAACTGTRSFPHASGRFPAGSECATIDDRWATVADADRACARDEDCQVVTGVCFAAALSARAAGDPRFHDTPCPDPAGGMCPEPAAPPRAACDQGCCVVVQPEPGW